MRGGVEVTVEGVQAGAMAAGAVAASEEKGGGGGEEEGGVGMGEGGRVLPRKNESPLLFITALLTLG